jgi:hypothetical protein
MMRTGCATQSDLHGLRKATLIFVTICRSTLYCAVVGGTRMIIADFQRVVFTLLCLVTVSAGRVSSAPPSSGTPPDIDSSLPSGWTAVSPRDEIRPEFSFESQGGPTHTSPCSGLTAAGRWDRLAKNGWARKVRHQIPMLPAMDTEPVLSCFRMISRNAIASGFVGFFRMNRLRKHSG